MRPLLFSRKSMYLPIPPQRDCAFAWREAVRAVDAQPGHRAYNVVIDVSDPVSNTTREDARIAVVDDFLSGCDKSVETVANTIFPAGLYHRYGAPAFFDVFRDNVLKKVRRNAMVRVLFRADDAIPCSGGRAAESALEYRRAHPRRARPRAEQIRALAVRPGQGRR